ncbi:MAG TPA: hexose kinase [Microbacterium sp.]|uniref:1-phosphofructokinase family hexose kinase n=1 Tax=Microbacterium sp. TaxID=51671 RepID=UPI002BCE2BD6|nr:hexose kinase [Microbacterium sp.]HWI30341.1 hexose kinase [Microbacterium sp.]
MTPNPSLDRAIMLDAPLETGAVQRAAGERQDAGGKGINVSRALAAAGVDTVALFPAAASDPFIALVEESGVTAHALPVDGRVRSNITLVDPAGTTTKINLPGDASVAEAADEVIAAIVQASAAANWLVLAGSLPPGLGNDFFARVTRTVRLRGGDDAPRIAVDTSGPPLTEALEAHPDLIKPNGEELAELLGEDPGDDAEHPAVALERARRLVPSRAAAALVTLGARGALYVDATTSLFAPAPKITVRSTVGAGDSSLAGFLIPDAGTSADRLVSAVAYGAAAASLPGTQTPTPMDASMPVTVTDWTAGPPAGL